MKAHSTLIQELFRREFSKMVAVIGNRFGLEYLDVAEDIVSDTFLKAAETWAARGLPPNPEAWLYAVAKQKMLYHLRRNKILRDKVLPHIAAFQPAMTENEEMDFSGAHIQDSQLRMMFAVCDPAIASEAQIALALRVLAGFGIEEIAEAFLTSKETINKRLYRAREKLRREKISLEMPSERQIAERVESVLRILYLMFNEGYYSATQNEILRKDFCLEAMRLATLLTTYKLTDLPETNALLALMCFHASRFGARYTQEGGYILYDDQNESLWDQDLIRRGTWFLDRSATGKAFSSYHLEAGIAFWHSRKEDTPEKWENILRYYDLLLQINETPAVRLNRAYALFKVKGREKALQEAEQLPLTGNPFYHMLLGELYRGEDHSAAEREFSLARAFARTEADRLMIGKKIDALHKDSKN